MLPAHQYTAEQDRGVNGRNLGIEGPRTRRHVHEVIEEPIHPMRLQSVQHKIERRLHASRDGCTRLVATLIANAERRQSESGCRYTRYLSCVVSRGESAVLHLPSRWVRLLPEEKKPGLLDFLEQLVVSPCVAISRR